MSLGWFRPVALTVASITAIGAAVALSPSVGTAASAQVTSLADGQPSTVGALFTLTASGQLSTHFCTASVVDSPAGDLVMTAAHCMGGRTASQVAFVPDYANGQAPFGVWTVSQVIDDLGWQSSANPDDDFAFLIVHQQGSTGSVEALTGGEVLGMGVPAGQAVTVAGYPDGQDAPISCENTVLDFSSTQFQFDCDGYTDGTSGSPLLVKAGPFGVETVIGVIGGYQQGGDTASVSYAAKLSTQMNALYQTALAAASS
ncbi:MAG TPA: trypsin-like peptidase domain-containing protein [Streptosporangiaceae bacterium]|jgi:V8-like Glu-specific endopeptidase